MTSSGGTSSKTHAADHGSTAADGPSIVDLVENASSSSSSSSESSDSINDAQTHTNTNIHTHSR